MSRLWYDHPAKEWEEALPIGNGRIGAMVYGGTDRERLQVNEESIWLGGAGNRHNPDAKANLPKIRRLLREGRISEAEHLMETALSGCPEGMHPYQTLGEIQLFFDGIEGGSGALFCGLSGGKGRVSGDESFGFPGKHVSSAKRRERLLLYRGHHGQSDPAGSVPWLPGGMDGAGRTGPGEMRDPGGQGCERADGRNP